MLERPEWDDFFLAAAFLVAQRSPDAETKHGAVIVDDRRRILGTGFNGFPRGAQDHLLPTSRPGKYPFVIHAEANALINCHGLDRPDACTIYVTGEPCNECFKLILQYGLGRLVHAGVGSTCIDANSEHARVRATLAEGLDLDVRVVENIDPVLRVLDATADYTRKRG